MEVDKILILTYSNMGLDVCNAVLSDHPDLWFMSANPFDAILTMSAKSPSALQSSLKRAADYVVDALSCQLNETQTHLIRKRSMMHMCKESDQVHQVLCLNNLCRQKGTQIVALRDIKLTDLESVIHRFKHRIKVVLTF